MPAFYLQKGFPDRQIQQIILFYMVVLGAYLKAKNLIEWVMVIEAVKKSFAGKGEALIQLNLQALEEGGKLV